MRLSVEAQVVPTALTEGLDAAIPPQLLVVLGFWSFIAVLTFINALLNDAMTPGPHLPVGAPLIAAIADALIWALLTPAIFWLTSRYSLEGPKRIWSVLLLLVLGIGVSIAASRVMAHVRYQQAVYYHVEGIIFQPFGTNNPAPIARRFWFMNEFEIYLVIMAAGFARDYFRRYRARSEQANALRIQASTLRAQLTDSRLNALRMQLNPHFLFNSLNTVSALVERDPRNARWMIARLSDLLRETLEGAALEVPLSKELSSVNRYIDIMKTRFHDRLQVAEDIDPATLNAMVPNFILQPLVENAIKHGVEHHEGAGKIELRARREGDLLILSVIDNGPTESADRQHEKHSSSGVGLRNTRERLAQSYGERQSLTLRANQGGGVIADVSLPFHTEILSATLA